MMRVSLSGPGDGRIGVIEGSSEPHVGITPVPVPTSTSPSCCSSRWRRLGKPSVAESGRGTLNFGDGSYFLSNTSVKTIGKHGGDEIERIFRI